MIKYPIKINVSRATWSKVQLFNFLMISSVLTLISSLIVLLYFASPIFFNENLSSEMRMIPLIFIFGDILGFGGIIYYLKKKIDEFSYSFLSSVEITKDYIILNETDGKKTSQKRIKKSSIQNFRIDGCFDLVEVISRYGNKMKARQISYAIKITLDTQKEINYFLQCDDSMLGYNKLLLYDIAKVKKCIPNLDIHLTGNDEYHIKNIEHVFSCGKELNMSDKSKLYMKHFGCGLTAAIIAIIIVISLFIFQPPTETAKSISLAIKTLLILSSAILSVLYLILKKR